MAKPIPIKPSVPVVVAPAPDPGEKCNTDKDCNPDVFNKNKCCAQVTTKNGSGYKKCIPKTENGAMSGVGDA